MSLRARIFILISLVILLVLGISIALLIRSRKSPASTGNDISTTGGQTVVTNEPGQPVISVTPEPTVAEPPSADPVKVEQAGVKNLARVFIERYNTYSSDNNWQNIREIETLVTPDLWKRLRSRIGVSATGGFVGVTTEVAGIELTLWQEGEATVVVKTIRTVAQGGKTEQQYQDISVSLIKSGSNWLVASFAVQK